MGTRLPTSHCVQLGSCRNCVEWQHLLWRGLFHFPVYRGPARAQPARFACRTLPTTPAAKQ
jgi:hypothetical protein